MLSTRDHSLLQIFEYSHCNEWFKDRSLAIAMMGKLAIGVSLRRLGPSGKCLRNQLNKVCYFGSCRKHLSSKAGMVRILRDNGLPIVILGSYQRDFVQLN